MMVSHLDLSPLEELSILTLRHGCLLYCSRGPDLDDKQQSVNCP